MHTKLAVAVRLGDARIVVDMARQSYQGSAPRTVHPQERRGAADLGAVVILENRPVAHPFPDELPFPLQPCPRRGYGAPLLVRALRDHSFDGDSALRGAASRSEAIASPSSLEGARPSESLQGSPATRIDRIGILRTRSV